MKNILSLLILFACGFTACRKADEFLEQKPATNLVVPTTIKDMQALLDYSDLMNETPALGEQGCDDYFLDDAYWLTLRSKDHNAYIWAPDIYEGTVSVTDWNNPCAQVFYANVVLEGLDKIVPASSDLAAYRLVKGMALFQRGFAFYNLAQVFAPVYDSAKAASQDGVVLRLSAAIDAPSHRATLADTYQQIILDITTSLNFLPPEIAFTNRNRPSKPAAFALLSRIFLNAGNYTQAERWADSCLQLYGTLINYNNVSTTASTPFAKDNAEVLYQTRMVSTTGVFYNASCYVDTLLYRSYSSPDLRKALLFKTPNAAGRANMKNGYSGGIFPFSGLATDEVWLNKSECAARGGNKVAAMAALNTLLANRYKTGTPQATATDAKDALRQVLTERRKELPFRGLRFSDIRRLNREGYAITPIRTAGGQSYSLAPNSPLYVLPIPPDEIILSGITQNPR